MCPARHCPLMAQAPLDGSHAGRVVLTDIIDYNAMDDDSFRTTIREWVEQNYPQALRFPPKRLHFTQSRPWFLALAAKGWLAPGWPRAHGGMALSPAKHLAMIEEFERFGCGRFNDSGINMLGPLLLRYGTDAQRSFFLPAILSGDHIWCQGYSEPEAGSDLASLRTKAVLDGDEWVVNGQKAWTTLGNDANWMFCLVRTDSNVRKQDGISFLLIPMDSSGVTVRPVLTLDMHDQFCEVHLDNVRVAAGNLVGEVNRGWHIAKTLLGFERISIGSPKLSSNALARLRAMAVHADVWDDPCFRTTYAELHMELEDLRSLYEVEAGRIKRGEAPGPDISVLKVVQSELFQRITETMLEIAGPESGLIESIAGRPELNASGLFLQSRPTTIYGGSNEIQRNIVAKNILGLG